MSERYWTEHLDNGLYFIHDSEKKKLIPVLEGDGIVKLLNEQDKEIKTLKSLLKELVR